MRGAGVCIRKERSSNFLKTSLSLVGMKGFEPSTSTSRTWRANRTALHPALKATQIINYPDAIQTSEDFFS